MSGSTRHGSRWWFAGALLVLAAGCASSGSVSSQVERELELGTDAARRGYWQEALMRFENANAVSPRNPRILNNLAVAYEAVARYEEARATYEAGLALAPGDRNLTRNYNFFKDFFASYVRRPEPDEGAEEGQASENTEAGDAPSGG